MVSLSLPQSVSLLLHSVSGPGRKLANCWSQFPPWTLLLFSLHQPSIIQETILESDSKLFSLHLILEIGQVQPFYYPGNNQGNVLKKVLKTQFSSSKIQWKNHAAAFPAVSHI